MTSDTYKADKAWGQCFDTTQDGIAPIAAYRDSLPYAPPLNCESGHYYMLNNPTRVSCPTAQSIRPTSQRAPKCRYRGCA